MASRREPVMVAGRLKGMGREARCFVAAVKVSMPSSNLYEYARVVIFDAPDDLPDGHYILIFDERTVRVQRHGGAWLAPVV